MSVERIKRRILSENVAKRGSEKQNGHKFGKNVAIYSGRSQEYEKFRPGKAARATSEACHADRLTPGRQLAGARIYGVPAFCSRKADEREWRGTGVQESCATETLTGPHQRPAMLTA